MTQYAKIIADPDKLREFIEWLPELQEDETFYLCLFGRSKYCKGLAHVRSDKAQLKRFTSNKSRLYNKILQLECPIETYTMKEVGTDNQIILPQEALALYITINPRSFIKATRKSLTKLLDLALQPYNGFHPYQEVMSEVQKARGKQRFMNFDFDIPKETWQTVFELVKKAVNDEALSVVETRGGYHVIVRTELLTEDRQVKGRWYNEMRKILAIYSSDHDNAGDIMLPVPGTYQGGFIPKFIKL